MHLKKKRFLGVVGVVSRRPVTLHRCVYHVPNVRVIQKHVYTPPIIFLRLSEMRTSFPFCCWCRFFHCFAATGVFEVRATSGNSHLGGEDFDHRLVKYCITQVGMIR